MDKNKNKNKIFKSYYGLDEKRSDYKYIKLLIIGKIVSRIYMKIIMKNNELDK